MPTHDLLPPHPPLLRSGSDDARARAAVELVALAAAGHVPRQKLLDLGTVVVGHPLDAHAWHLRGWTQSKTLPPGLALKVMAAVLAASFQPQSDGARLGASGRQWLKDANGNVDRQLVPATLPPHLLAQWIGKQCRRWIRALVEKGDQGWSSPEDAATAHGEPEELTPWQAWAPASPDDELVGEERLCHLLAAVTPREAEVLVLHLDGFTQHEIAAQLGIERRTVRGHLEQIEQKANTFDPDAANPARGGGTTDTRTIMRKRKWNPDKELLTLVRPMSAHEVADAHEGYNQQLYRARAESRDRLVALHGIEWWNDPRPENRWDGRRDEHEEEWAAAERVNRAAALGAGPFTIPGLRFGAPGEPRESWTGGTYGTADEALNALDRLREGRDPDVIFGIVRPAKIAEVPVSQQPANELMACAAERSAA
jgi:RNA polymerase sigma factor (sigma-70 family)